MFSGRAGYLFTNDFQGENVIYCKTLVYLPEITRPTEGAGARGQVANHRDSPECHVNLSS